MKIFGENVDGYNVPVLNEREIRASAGILLLFLVVSMMQAILKMEFLTLKYFIIVFLADLSIRIFVNPKYSPVLIIGRLIVSKQVPEYVSAAPKKFAWIIGLTLAMIMFIHMVIGNTYSVITGIICMICLIFLFFESSFGIFLGCLFYPLFFKKKEQYCSGDFCIVKAKHDIQKTSIEQIFMIIGFIVFVLLVYYIFNAYLSDKPEALSFI